MAERCGRQVGSRPWWMGPDQYDPCHCIRDKGHDGECRCTHTGPRCTSDITLRDEEHRLCRCSLLAGHDGHHDDGEGTTWTARTPDTESEEGR